MKLKLIQQQVKTGGNTSVRGGNPLSASTADHKVAYIREDNFTWLKGKVALYLPCSLSVMFQRIYFKISECTCPYV